MHTANTIQQGVCQKEVDTIVWNMKGLDFILGLPDIVRNFITSFFMMLQDYHDELVNGISERTEVEHEAL